MKTSGDKMKSVAIIGAGIAGLGAARELCRADIAVTFFEKSRGLGGRVATRRLNGCTVDHGAQVIKPQGSALEKVILNELPTDDLISISAPVRVYQNDGTILPVDPRHASEPQYTYRNGISTLAKLLYAALPQEWVTFHSETCIARIEETKQGYEIYDETDTHRGQFDAVILTPPTPQTVGLIRASKWRDESEMLRRTKLLATVEYNPCLTVLLGYTASVPEPPAYALLAEDRSRPLLWLAFEQVKTSERAPNGGAVLIAQLGGEFSTVHYRSPDAEILDATLREMESVFGNDYARPAWWEVKRWLFSQPKNGVSFAEVNVSGSRIIVCGDGLRPERGRVHQAFDSGLEAAELLLKMKA